MSSQIASALTNHFLIAMPDMSDPNFEGSVIYLAEHSPDGAMGLIINRSIDLTLESVFSAEDIDIAPALANEPVFCGGPVDSDRGYVLHRPGTVWDATQQISGDVAMTASRDVLEAVVSGAGPDQWLVMLGCSGWGAGQLEQELANNVWLTVPADAQLIFDTPAEQRLARAYSLMGFDPTQLSGVAGHA